MNYLLNAISPQEADHVLKAAATLGDAYSGSGFAQLLKSSLAHWAQDAESGNFLACLPDELRQESSGKKYVFRCQGATYLVEVPSMFGNEAVFMPAPGMTGQAQELVQAELTAAFKAHGRFGIGGDDGFVPEFNF